jgi:dodecin
MLEGAAPVVTVLYVDLAPDEEALVLATLDPIGAMAGRDEDKLRALPAAAGWSASGTDPTAGSPTAHPGPRPANPAMRLQCAPRRSGVRLIGAIPAPSDHTQEVFTMSVARVTEISSRSDRSFEAAINEGIERANKTLRNVRSAWIKEQQVDIEDGRIVAYRVNMLITFVLDD